MKTILAFLLGTVITSVSFGQEVPDLLKYRRDIGFNTNIVFAGIFNSGSESFNLMYKRQVTDDKAWRYGVALSSSTRAFPSFNSTQETSDHFARLTIGKEWQTLLSKRWVFYHGADLGLSVNINHFSSYNNTLSQTIEKRNSTTVGYAFRPFLGIRFQITERLYASAESYFSMSYNRQQTTFELFDFVTNNILTSKNTSNLYDIRLLPAAGIFVFYRF